MYIPVSYWQTQGGGIPHMRAMHFALAGTPNINYKYNNISYTTPTITGRVVKAVCQDSNNNTELEKAPIYQAGASFFCSAAISGTIGINTPPETGAEAWYIEIFYPRNAQFNLGTCFFNYIDQNGNIINDSLTQAQVKKTIISQSNPLISRNENTFYQNFMPWTVKEKFPGQVLQYPYFNVPSTYTIQLKRDVQTTGEFVRPYQSYYSGSTNSVSYVGQFEGFVTSSLNATWNIIANTPPIDNSITLNANVPSVWITNVVPVPKTALNLTSCVTTNSLWVTLDNYDAYTTGSILKVTNAELNATSSCWSVTALTSSLSTSVALTNVNVTQSFGVGQCLSCLGYNPINATGGTTGSFVQGGTTFKYHAFTSNGTFNVLTGSINNARLLVIAGGGGGGDAAGGGAGGYVYNPNYFISQSTYSVSVGTGGTGYNGGGFGNYATNGNNSQFYNTIAIGGGAGAGRIGAGNPTNGGDGGSGGGGNYLGQPGSGTAGQGNGGGSATQTFAGGGGGAAAQGQNRYGGAGIDFGTATTGIATTYCVGGSIINNGTTSTSGSGGEGGGGATPGKVGLNGLVIITYPIL